MRVVVASGVVGIGAAVLGTVLARVPDTAEAETVFVPIDREQDIGKHLCRMHLHVKCICCKKQYLDNRLDSHGHAVKN